MNEDIIRRTAFQDLAYANSCRRGTSHIDRVWIANAVQLLEKERHKSATTPLIPIPCPEIEGVQIYLKDETRHPSGSLKHRLAHALFLHAICNGDICSDTLVIEASSGSTAISEAWFARALGLPFCAVVPETTAPTKVDLIRDMGGRIHFAQSRKDIRSEARELAIHAGGHFMDQFGMAAEVSDWRGSNNIADSLFAQLADTSHINPAYVVVGAGTGGTSTTIGRYIRLKPDLASVRLCVVDPEGSAFFKAFTSGDMSSSGDYSSVVEGIGRANVEPSFVLNVIDRMISISDYASVIGAHWLNSRTHQCFGPSTGTNIIGCLILAQEMQRRGEKGAIVTLGCDDGARYGSTIFNHEWLDSHGIHFDEWERLPEELAEFFHPRPTSKGTKWWRVDS